MEKWRIKLERLFSSLGQDPLECAPSIMDIEGTETEKEEWLEIISFALSAAKANNNAVISIVNYSGYKISKPVEYIDYFLELRTLYIKELDVL